MTQKVGLLLDADGYVEISAVNIFRLAGGICDLQLVANKGGRPIGVPRIRAALVRPLLLNGPAAGACDSVTIATFPNGSTGLQRNAPVRQGWMDGTPAPYSLFVILL